MTRGVFLLFINLLIVLSKGKTVNLKIVCKKGLWFHVKYSEDDFTWQNIYDALHLPKPKNTDTDTVIIAEVPLFSKLRFYVQRNDNLNICTVENEEDKKLSEGNDKEHWVFVGYMEFTDDDEIWEYLNIGIGNYYHPRNIQFDANVVTKYFNKYYALGRIVNFKDDNVHKMISIQMKIKVNYIVGNAGDNCMIFALSNKNYYEYQTSDETFLPHIYVEIIDESAGEFNIIVIFGSKKFAVKGTLENEILVKINMYPMNSMYAVKFNHDPNSVYYRWEKDYLFFEEFLTLWIGQDISSPDAGAIRGYISELKIKDKILPCGLKEYQSNGCQTNVATNNAEIQATMDAKEMHVQTDANSRTTTPESEPTTNNNSKNDSNKSRLHIIIICSTIGIILSLLSIFIIMTCRRKNGIENIKSKETNIQGSSTKKVHLASQNKAFPDNNIDINIDLPKIPPPPPPIFMNDYIDSPKIKQFYKTPQYKQETSQPITREGRNSTKIPPPPPMNIGDNIDASKKTNQKPRQFRSTNDPY